MKEQEKAINDILNKAGLKTSDSKIIIPGQEVNQMQEMAAFINNLTEQIDEALGQLQSGISKIGQGLDLTRLQLFMMYKILTDKGICSEEEIKEYYKKEVKEKLLEMQKEMTEKIKDMQSKKESTEGE